MSSGDGPQLILCRPLKPFKRFVAGVRRKLDASMTMQYRGNRAGARHRLVLSGPARFRLLNLCRNRVFANCYVDTSLNFPSIKEPGATQAPTDIQSNFFILLDLGVVSRIRQFPVVPAASPGAINRGALRARPTKISSVSMAEEKPNSLNHRIFLENTGRFGYNIYC
jgi:hypothetical protein